MTRRWSDPRADGTLVHDVVVDGWSRPWNLKSERAVGGWCSGVVPVSTSRPTAPPQWRTWEIGYVLNPRDWGNGYATEACRMLLRDRFVDRSAHRVVAHCDPRNTRSWALLERLGFRREAHLRAAASFAVDDAGDPVWHDAFGYGLLADEWERAAVR